MNLRFEFPLVHVRWKMLLNALWLCFAVPICSKVSIVILFGDFINASQLFHVAITFWFHLPSRWEHATCSMHLLLPFLIFCHNFLMELFMPGICKCIVLCVIYLRIGYESSKIEFVPRCKKSIYPKTYVNTFYTGLWRISSFLVFTVQITGYVPIWI